MGKHDDKQRDEDERKQQSNGQPPPGTQISRKESEGRHSALDESKDEE